MSVIRKTLLLASTGRFLIKAVCFSLNDHLLLMLCMQMDVQTQIGSVASYSCCLLFKATRLQTVSSSSSSSSLRPCCTKSKQPQEANDDDKDDKSSTDWDKAWTNFRKQVKKSMLSQFSPNKYVTWNPRRSNYPLSEEVDPIKRTERTNLMLWTSPGFTLVGAIIIVTFLLIYTILAPIK